MNADDLPAPQPAVDVFDSEFIDLLAEPMASTWTPHVGRSDILRERLLDRVARSARASRAFVTVRRKDAPAEALAAGVVQRVLYEAAERATRAGEPRRVRIVELAAGASWHADVLEGETCEWLVMAGEVCVDGVVMGARDFHRACAGGAPPVLDSATGATLYMRQCATALPSQPEAPVTVRDAEAGWQDYGPGIRRRVMWSRDGLAALLYHARPGAQVPRHGHKHDEECLMLAGEVFLDDVLLRQGDYQLAPAGTHHQGISTDTGGVLFAHGDLDLDIQVA